MSVRRFPPEPDALPEIEGQPVAPPPGSRPGLRRARLLLACALVYVAGVLGYFVFRYTDDRAGRLAALDARLLAGACGVKYLLGEDWHDRFTGGAPGKDTDLDAVRRLTRYAREAGLKFLYTMVLDGTNVVFTASSATDEELAKGTWPRWRDPYPEATAANRAAFHAAGPVYEESRDRWGEFRSVLVPARSPGGRVYLLGADILLGDVRAVFRETLLESAATACLFLLLGAPLFLLYRAHLRRGREELEAEVKARTEEIRALNQTLEARVLAALARERDKDALLLRQSRHAAMGEMIAAIAHQWRQPLAAIGMLSQNLVAAWAAGKVDGEYLRGKAGQTLELVRHLSQTIDDFRDFFKPDKPRVRFDLGDAARQAAVFVEGNLRQARVALLVEAPEPVPATGFPNEFAQVLLILLNNARDAIQAVGPPAGHVLVRAFREGSRAVLTVTDDGGGIPEEVQARIFEPYFTTRDAGTGTGLGLAIAELIVVSNMGGTITAANVERDWPARGPARGAEFRIELPPAR